MEASTDGKGKDREDIKVASSELAAGTQALEDSLGTKQVQALMAQVGSMVQTGNELIAQTEQLESGMQKGVAEPVTNIVKRTYCIAERTGRTQYPVNESEDYL